MKPNAVFFTILILSGSVSIAYAHPDPVVVTVQNENDMILYTNDLGAIVEDESEPIELFTAKWFYRTHPKTLQYIMIHAR